MTEEKRQTNLSLDPVRISFVDDLLDSSRNEDIARFVEQVLASVRLSSRESHNGSVFNFVVFQFLETAKAAKD